LEGLLRRVGKTERPIMVVCSPSLAGKRVKKGELLGRVVRDQWRSDAQGQACLIMSEEGDLVRHHDGEALQVSRLVNEAERSSVSSFRRCYLEYLVYQVKLHLGGMSRHVVSGFDRNGTAAFTWSQCYLPSGKELVFSENSLLVETVGSPFFLATELAPSDTPMRASKGDIIFGRRTVKSKLMPHSSGRPTLVWINVSRCPGLEGFLRFCADPPTDENGRITQRVADAAVRSMLNDKEQHTVFSTLVDGYFAPKTCDKAVFDAMKERVCWEYNL